MSSYSEYNPDRVSEHELKIRVASALDLAETGKTSPVRQIGMKSLLDSGAALIEYDPFLAAQTLWVCARLSDKEIRFLDVPSQDHHAVDRVDGIRLTVLSRLDRAFQAAGEQDRLRALTLSREMLTEEAWTGTMSLHAGCYFVEQVRACPPQHRDQAIAEVLTVQGYPGLDRDHGWVMEKLLHQLDADRFPAPPEKVADWLAAHPPKPASPA